VFLLLLAFSPGGLPAQSEGAGTAPIAAAPSQTTTVPDTAAPTTAAPNTAGQSASVPPQTQPQPESSVPLPPAMASRSKAPASSEYEEVHIQPMVNSTGKAKFGLKSDPKSDPKSEMDPGLRTHTRPLRVDVDMVLVPVTITDPSDRPVLGLAKENFIVMDNGEPQRIENFSCEDGPISVGVIFDISGSMSHKIGKAREAVTEFLKTANPEDEFFLIAFSNKPELMSDFTPSVEAVQRNMMYMVPKGRTALLDAVYLGISKMRQARHRRKALLVLSDGGDNSSRYTENEIRAIVKEADVQIYAIGIFDLNPRTSEELYGPGLLSDISEVTGGRAYTVGSPNDLSEVAGKIGVELRNQYVLGYRPSNSARDGKWRKVRVKLTATKGLPPLTVYAKMGYYAPGR
jgi:Ca-activated chloride channel homolog